MMVLVNQHALLGQTASVKATSTSGAKKQMILWHQCVLQKQIIVTHATQQGVHVPCVRTQCSSTTARANWNALLGQTASVKATSTSGAKKQMMLRHQCVLQKQIIVMYATQQRVRARCARTQCFFTMVRAIPHALLVQTVRARATSTNVVKRLSQPAVRAKPLYMLTPQHHLTPQYQRLPPQLLLTSQRPQPTQRHPLPQQHRKTLQRQRQRTPHQAQYLAPILHPTPALSQAMMTRQVLLPHPPQLPMLHHIAHQQMRWNVPRCVEAAYHASDPRIQTVVDAKCAMFSVTPSKTAWLLTQNRQTNRLLQ
jgi:hypothetical protein